MRQSDYSTAPETFRDNSTTAVDFSTSCKQVIVVYLTHVPRLPPTPIYTIPRSLRTAIIFKRPPMPIPQTMKHMY